VLLAVGAAVWFLDSDNSDDSAQATATSSTQSSALPAVPGFVVQLGDPQSKTLPMDHPDMGTGGPGYTINAEFNKRKFERGMLGMARKNDPNSAGSQFYIMLGPADHLNGQYTAFGRVVSGMEVVDTIKVGDRVKSIKVSS